MGVPDVQFRLLSAERRLDKLEERTEDFSALRVDIANLRKEFAQFRIDVHDAFEDLREETKATRRSVVVAAISFAGGALILAVSILVAVAH